jgi:hypothetical protein
MAAIFEPELPDDYFDADDAQFASPPPSPAPPGGPPGDPPASGPPPPPPVTTAEAIAVARSLLAAARAGDVAVFTRWLAAGLVPNLANDKGDTFIMLAAYHGHAQLVKGLLEYDADPNILNDRGQSPLAGAIFKGEDEVVEVCNSPFPRRFFPLAPIWNGMADVIEKQALLAGGADPEYGSPSAMEAMVLFKQQSKWKGKFEAAPGRGQVRAQEEEKEMDDGVDGA